MEEHDPEHCSTPPQETLHSFLPFLLLQEVDNPKFVCKETNQNIYIKIKPDWQTNCEQSAPPPTFSSVSASHSSVSDVELEVKQHLMVLYCEGQ